MTEEKTGLMARPPPQSLLARRSLTNGNGLTNGNAMRGPGAANGLTNGLGRTNGTGLVNGNGLTNGNAMRGPGAANGLTNGLGRTNGTGLVNGNGLTNGLNASAPAKRPRRSEVRALSCVVVIVGMLAVISLPWTINQTAPPPTDSYADAIALAVYDQTQSYGLYADISTLYLVVDLSAPLPRDACGYRVYLDVPGHPVPYRALGLDASHRVDIPLSDPAQPTLYTHGGRAEDPLSMYDAAGWTDPAAPHYSAPASLKEHCARSGDYVVVQVRGMSLSTDIVDAGEVRALFSIILELPDGSFSYSDALSLLSRQECENRQVADILSVGEPSRTATAPFRLGARGNVTSLEVRDGVYVASFDQPRADRTADIDQPSPSTNDGGGSHADGTPQGSGSTPSQAGTPPQAATPTYTPSYAHTQFWVNGSGGDRSFIHHEGEVIGTQGYFKLSEAEAEFDCEGHFMSFVVRGHGIWGAATCWMPPGNDRSTRGDVSGQTGREIKLDGTGNTDGTGTIANMQDEDYDTVLEVDQGEYLNPTGFSRGNNHLNATIIAVNLKATFKTQDADYAGSNKVWYRNGSGSQTWLNSSILPSSATTSWTNQTTNITELTIWDWTAIGGLELYWYNDDGDDTEWVQWDHIWLEIHYDIGLNGSDVVINEVLYNPTGTDADNQWVELYNPGSMSVDIGEGDTSAWYIANANQTRKAYLNGAISADGYLVVYLNASGENSSTNCYPVIQEGGGVNGVMFSTTSKDGCYLFDENGEPWDYVQWNGTAGTEVDVATNYDIWGGGTLYLCTYGGAVTEGQSIGRDRNGNDTDHKDDWGKVAPPPFYSDPYGVDRTRGPSPEESNDGEATIPTLSEYGLMIACGILAAVPIIRRRRWPR